MRILSLPGTQNARSRASMASSDPTPTNRFSGRSSMFVWSLVLRSSQRRCFRGIWCLLRGNDYQPLPNRMYDVVVRFDSRVRVSVQAPEIKLEIVVGAIDTVSELANALNGYPGTIGVLVRVQKDVGAVIFVVTASSAIRSRCNIGGPIALQLTRERSGMAPEPGYSAWRRSRG